MLGVGVLKRLRAGELTSVSMGAAVADGFGDVRDVQPWGDLLTRAAGTLPVVGGWVDSGRVLSLGDGRSRYEEFAALRSDVRRDPRTCVRGPAWRILLGPGHLELLGGRDRLEASGLFTDLQEIDTPDGPLLMVQCGAQPTDCTAEQRARMVEVLAPVLPPWPA